MNEDQLRFMCFKARKFGYVPYQLALIDGQMVEIISYPYIMECGKIAIKVREPNDPTTIRDAMVPVDPIMMDLEV